MRKEAERKRVNESAGIRLESPTEFNFWKNESDSAGGLRRISGHVLSSHEDFFWLDRSDVTRCGAMMLTHSVRVLDNLWI